MAAFDFDRITSGFLNILKNERALIAAGSYSEVYKRKCPNCGEPLQWTRYLSGARKGDWTHHGDPLDECPVCERELPDDDPVSDELAARRAR